MSGGKEEDVSLSRNADKKLDQIDVAAVDTSLSLTYSLMGLQLLTRVVTFALNQALVRLSTPQVYGTVSIQLELLLNTILFLSREGFRNALLRADTNVGKEGDRRRVANIALLPIYFGVPVAMSASALYVYYASDATRVQPYFQITVLIYALAAFLELLSEPLFIRDVQSFNSVVRMKAEGFAVIAKALMTTVVLARDADNLGLIAFALGQFTYSCTMLLVYLSRYGSSVSFLIKRQLGESTPPANSDTTSARGLAAKSSAFFDQSILEVSLAMTGQGFAKHVLTEGDKVVLSRFSSLEDQGGYAVANNYGSLVARICFQPIEESSRIFFSKTLSSPGSKIEAFQTAQTRLQSILLFYSHLMLILVAFAPANLPVVLAILLPPKYLNTSAPGVLSVWVYYIPVLAINGIVEAFVASVANASDLAKQTKFMTVSSIAYIIFTVALFRSGVFGDSALIYANIINLCGRSVYGARVIAEVSRRYDFKGPTLSPRQCLPPRVVFLVLFLAGCSSMWSFTALNVAEQIRLSKYEILMSHSIWKHIAVGLAGILAVLITCIFSEAERVQGFVSALTTSRKKKTE